jgi:hypothetical protein
LTRDPRLPPCPSPLLFAVAGAKSGAAPALPEPPVSLLPVRSEPRALLPPLRGHLPPTLWLAPPPWPVRPPPLAGAKSEAEGVAAAIAGPLPREPRQALPVPGREPRRAAPPSRGRRSDHGRFPAAVAGQLPPEPRQALRAKSEAAGVAVPVVVVATIIGSLPPLAGSSAWLAWLCRSSGPALPPALPPPLLPPPLPVPGAAPAQRHVRRRCRGRCCLPLPPGPWSVFAAVGAAAVAGVRSGAPGRRGCCRAAYASARSRAA